MLYEKNFCGSRIALLVRLLTLPRYDCGKAHAEKNLMTWRLIHKYWLRP